MSIAMWIIAGGVTVIALVVVGYVICEILIGIGVIR